MNFEVYNVAIANFFLAAHGTGLLKKFHVEIYLS